MITMDYEAIKTSDLHLINIRDVSRNYATSFWLEDGKEMTVRYPDGLSLTRKCAYLDDYHFNFGFNCYHIDQFAEMLAKSNAECFPEEYITDLNMYKKFYADRDFIGSDGKKIPYRSIVALNPDSYGIPETVISICSSALYNRQVAVSTVTATGLCENNYYSIATAKNDALSGLDLTDHEQNLLRSVFDSHAKEIIHITSNDYSAIPDDYKGVYEDFDGKHPEWKGCKTAFLPGHGTTLFIEGVSFVIDNNRPSLDQIVKTAADKCENIHKEHISKPLERW